MPVLLSAAGNRIATRNTKRHKKSTIAYFIELNFLCLLVLFVAIKSVKISGSPSVPPWLKTKILKIATC